MKLIAALLLVAAAEGAHAAKLEADTFDLDLETGVQIYRGNVAFELDGVRLYCDQLTARRDAAERMQESVCEGAPGRFERRDAASDISGSAGRIHFNHAQNTVTLEQDARVTQNGEHIRAARIVYDLSSKQLRASGGAERARMQIQPRGEGN